MPIDEWTGNRGPRDVEPDPRTDGVGDQGELPPLTGRELEAATERERSRRRAIIDDPATPYTEDPADDAYEDGRMDAEGYPTEAP